MQLASDYSHSDGESNRKLSKRTNCSGNMLENPRKDEKLQ